VSERNSNQWLQPAEQAAWRAYIEVQGDLINAIERDLADHHLTLGDYQVLVYLSEAEEQSMRMCDLAEVLQLSPSGLTRRLDRLVAGGFVARQGSCDDRRVMMGSLTETGRGLLERTAPHHVGSVRRRIFDHLDESQVAAMTSIFTAIAAGLADSNQTNDPAAATTATA
jgi:DNA-binding MarR family transcriptional regulator